MRSAAFISRGRFTNAPTWNSLIVHSSPRLALAVLGTLPCSQRSAPLTGRSTRGITHGGVRWMTVRLPTSGWMDGTIWIADAPVPTMATRLPLRS